MYESILGANVTQRLEKGEAITIDNTDIETPGGS
jgi:hypothetical protein